MIFPPSSNTVVIGVGNTLLSDDGAGVHAARALECDARLPQGVTVLDGGTLGLELTAYASDASRVLLLDAINTGAAPGTVVRMTGPELLCTSNGWSVHQLGVADLISALALLSAVPQEIVVFGIQPEGTEWSTELTPAVKAGLPRLVDAAMKQLLDWENSKNDVTEVPAASVARSRISPAEGI
jgi:hydrogenase maturation protease